jgi:CO/xanthine dehydrogenase FAD-binding subunit
MQAYYRPSTVEEAVNILKENGDLLKPIAGCTDVGVALEEKILDRRNYLDLSFIDELKGIREKDGYIYIGALTTHAEIVESDIIKKAAPVLSMACSTIGSPLIRNRATIGGNVCHASPSGDSIPALMVLDSELLLKNSNNERWVPIGQFFTAPGKTKRDDSEILVSIRFKPLSDKHICIFHKLGQRKALACSKASMAFIAEVKGRQLRDVRIAMGAVAPTVVRGYKTEEFLNNREINAEIIKKASESVSSEVNPIDDLRSTAEYRKNMMGVLLEKSLNNLVNKNNMT